MSIFTSTLSSLVNVLSPHFLLSSFLPGLLFAFVGILLVPPDLTSAGIYQPPSGLSLEYLLAVAVIALGLGYALAVLNNPLWHLYQGHTFRHTWLGRLLIQTNIRRLQWINMEITRLEEAVRQNKMKAEVFEAVYSPDHWQNMEFRKAHHHYLQAWTSQLQLVNQLVKYFPLSEENILPTALGNVFAAVEDYTRYRYNIDLPVLWPHFRAVLAKSSSLDEVERQKMGCDFFLNLSFLSLALAFVYSAISIYVNAHLAIVTPLLCLLLSWFFYRLAIPAALSYGTALKTAIDLHRETLRKIVGLNTPIDFDHEVFTWGEFSRFIQIKYAGAETSIFVYPKPKDSPTAPASTATSDAH